MTMAPATEAGMADIERLTSAYPFAETLQKLRTALEDKGFTIFALIDQREAAGRPASTCRRPHSWSTAIRRGARR